MSKITKINGFSWDGVCYTRRIRSPLGLIHLNIICDESKTEFVQQQSKQMIELGENWQNVRPKVARIVTRYLFDLCNHSDVYGKIKPEELKLFSITAVWMNERASPFSMYNVKLIRGKEEILDEGQFLEIGTKINDKDPQIELATLN